MNINHESTGMAPQLPIPTCVVIPHCPLPTDIVLVSSDGHRFGAHSQNLGKFTNGFPVHIAPANGEEVQMPDLDSQELPLFLQYVHHHRQPDLSNVPFSTLRNLAEAVEKYDVYSATEICKMHMLSFVTDHCVEVFAYAAKYDYHKLMDSSGKIAVQKKRLSHEISMKLSKYQPHAKDAWRQYNERWRNSFSHCYHEPPPFPHPGGIKDCGKWRKFRNVVVSQVRREVAIFSQFGSIVEGARHHLKDCDTCCRRAGKWIGNVKGQARDWKTMPEFTSFL